MKKKETTIPTNKELKENLQEAIKSLNELTQNHLNEKSQKKVVETISSLEKMLLSLTEIIHHATDDKLKKKAMNAFDSCDEYFMLLVNCFDNLLFHYQCKKLVFDFEKLSLKLGDFNKKKNKFFSPKKLLYYRDFFKGYLLP